ncbi:unnamed protein product [Allacma fusca]|uniref:Uncharacterized protein n=1 Tax=Allacma fusca TaxID=39272 RepID=A0A8J2JAR4_9HEXA|nr:unnamed protein product [Allacma fusca]
MKNDLEQLLHPYLKRGREQSQTTSSSSFTGLQRNYLLLVLLSGAIVLYFGFTNSLFSVPFQYKHLLGKYKSLIHPFDNNESSTGSIFESLFSSAKVSDSSGWEPARQGDKKIELAGECIPINIKERKIKIPEKMNFIRIDCSIIKNNTSARVPVDLFGIVHLKKSVEKRVEKLIANQDSIKQRSNNGTAKSTVVDSSTGNNDAIPDRTLNVMASLKLLTILFRIWCQL